MRKMNISEFMDLWPRIENGLKLVKWLSLIGILVNIYMLTQDSFWLVDILNITMGLFCHTVASLVVKLVSTIKKQFGGMMV